MVRNIKRLKLAISSLSMLVSSFAPILHTPTFVLAAGSGYPASDVLGQLDGGGNPDFTTRTSGTTASKFNYPEGSALDTVHHRLFVNDANHRVLEFDLDASNNLIDHTADHVLGQPDFTTSGPHSTQNGFEFPYLGLWYDSSQNRLFVADDSNNRIMIFDLSGGITDGMNAAHVLGQPDFTTISSTTSQNKLSSPEDVTYDPASHNLFVADFSNSRVIVYDLSAGITDGMNAAHVLGQPDFTSHSIATTQDGLQLPESVRYNQTTKQLFVGDSGNARVIIYDLSAGITDGMNAAHVLGQPDFTTNTPTTTQNGLGRWIEGLGVDATRNKLYVADEANNRIIIFDLSAGITDGMNASLVLGQPDFTTSTATTTQTGINDPEGSIAVDSENNRIYVVDSSNNRVLVFNFAKVTSSSTTTVPPPVLGQPYSVNLGFQAHGTPTFSVVSGTLPPGLVLGANTGVLNGTPTANGTFNFTIKMVDDNGPAGTFTDSKAFSFVLGDSTTTPALAATGTPIILTTAGAALLMISARLTYRNRQKLYRLYGRR